MTETNVHRAAAEAKTATERADRAGIHLLVTIDTECDKGPQWRVRRPLSFGNIIEGVPRRLQPLFEKHRIKPTYLLSPEVLADDASAVLFRSLLGRADLGAHLHSEFIDPDSRPEAMRTDAVQCDLTPEVEFQKLANLTRLFEERIGFRPTAFRAGRFGIGRHTLVSLERLGYRVDSSVTPNRWWFIEKGRGVNFLGAPVQPYHPSADDFRRPGQMRILEVPVTVIHPFWDRLPPGLLRSLRPLSRAQTILLNLLGTNERRCQWLRPTFSDAQALMDVANSMSRRRGAGPIVLCMMFHSNEATKGASPYFDSDESVTRFLARMSDFFERLGEAYAVRSLGLSDMAPA